MNIKIESGAHVQITDKPIVNVFGDVNIGKKQDEAVDGVNAEDAEIVEEVKSRFEEPWRFGPLQTMLSAAFEISSTST